MKSAHKLIELQSQTNILFRICNSGLYCLGGINIMPKYYKTLNSCYNAYLKLIK